MEQEIQQVASHLARATSVAVLTGAGVSAESGIPTFREAQTGLWSRYDPNELATPLAFARDPELVWRWYSHRRELVARAEPNAGHRALAALEERIQDFTLITQNVDGLHRRAGSQRVVELHGNIMRARCHAGCSTPRDLAGGPDDRCPACGGPLRPAVVWFGEALPPGALEEAHAAALRCDLFLCLGTSALVQPAASLPLAAKDGGAHLVEINLEPTPISTRADLSIRGRTGQVLPRVMAC